MGWHRQGKVGLFGEEVTEGWEVLGIEELRP